ncbi:MAG: putative acetyltransferase [Actinomycetota bacterium]|nr:putative acetyltransferase [Actinomycetota bacterium]
MLDLIIVPDDPAAPDVRELLTQHLQFAHEHSPPEDVHALDSDGLRHDDVTFFSARVDGIVLGVGALRQLDATHAELKSMHTLASARGGGVGRAIVEHLLGVARERGCRRVSLETGTMAAFAPARALYASVGFTPCPPFADYRVSRNSMCMTLLLDG